METTPKPSNGVLTWYIWYEKESNVTNIDPLVNPTAGFQSSWVLAPFRFLGPTGKRHTNPRPEIETKQALLLGIAWNCYLAACRTTWRNCDVQVVRRCNEGSILTRDKIIGFLKFVGIASLFKNFVQQHVPKKNLPT